MSPKPLSCLFKLKVLCSFRKSEKVFGIMDTCLTCKYYVEFLKEMAEEDEKVMDEIDEMRRFRGEKM